MDLECVICYNLLTEDADSALTEPLSKRTKRSSQGPPTPAKTCLPTSAPELCSTKCGHVFHRVCLLEWLQTQKNCPSCRKATTEKQVGPLFLPTASAGKRCTHCTLVSVKVDCLIKENEKLREAEQKKNQADSTIQLEKKYRKKIDEVSKECEKQHKEKAKLIKQNEFLKAQITAFQKEAKELQKRKSEKKTLIKKPRKEQEPSDGVTPRRSTRNKSSTSLYSPSHPISSQRSNATIIISSDEDDYD